MASKKIYSIKTPDGNPVRCEEAWKDANGELLTEKVNKADAQTITGLKTFSSQVIASGGVKTDKVTSTNGTEVLAYNGTTTALKGKADRPTYNGNELATLDDAHKANDVILFISTPEFRLGNFSDRYLHNNLLYNTVFLGKNIYVFNGEILTSSSDTAHMFLNVGCDSVTIDSIGESTSLYYAFGCSRAVTACVKKVNAFDASNVKNIGDMFHGNKLITEIPAFDFSNVASALNAFSQCYAVTSFLPTGLKVSFSLSSCTKMTAEALRVVIDNIADVTELGTSPTLTLGSTNLAKLNADDITTANNKGWNLA